MNIITERIIVDSLGKKEKTLESIAEQIRNDLGIDMPSAVIQKPIQRLVLEGVIITTDLGYRVSTEILDRE